MNELGIYHLRRIGPGATKPGVLDVMDLHKVPTLIGRNRSQVDFLLDSSNFVSSQYISRLHARVVRQDNNLYRLYDDSLNGIFINNTKMCGSVVLQEGDTITFGHPWGVKLATGVWKRQPDSEYQFIFEKCTCNVGLHKAVLEDQTNLENTSTSFQFDHVTTNSNVDRTAHGILNSCVFRPPTSPIILSPSYTKFLPSSAFIHHGSENLDGASHSTPTKPQKRITDFFHSPRRKNTEQLGVCDVTYGADISECEVSEQEMCEFASNDGTVRPEMEADSIIYAFGVGNFCEKSKTVSEEIIAEMSNSVIEDSIAEVSNIVIEESIAEMSNVIIGESIAEVITIEDSIAELSNTVIEESIDEKLITFAKENLIEKSYLVSTENIIQESNTSSTEQKMDDGNKDCDKQISDALKYIPICGTGSKNRLQLKRIPHVTINQRKDGSLHKFYGKEPCASLTMCSENMGIPAPENEQVHQLGDAGFDRNDGDLISSSLLLDVERNKAQACCKARATSEQACTTVATSEQACTTMATSEQACTTMATSEQACTTVATSEQACTTMATSEQACTTVATSEQACTTVATSEQATLGWETTQVNRVDGKGTEPLADSGGGNIVIHEPPGPKSDTSPDTDGEKVDNLAVRKSFNASVVYCETRLQSDIGVVQCDTGVDHCDPGVDHCDAGVDHCDPGVDHCDAGVDHCDPGVDHCDAGVDHCGPGVNHCDKGVAATLYDQLPSPQSPNTMATPESNDSVDLSCNSCIKKTKSICENETTRSSCDINTEFLSVMGSELCEKTLNIIERCETCSYHIGTGSNSCNGKADVGVTISLENSTIHSALTSSEEVNDVHCFTLQDQTQCLFPVPGNVSIYNTASAVRKEIVQHICADFDEDFSQSDISVEGLQAVVQKVIEDPEDDVESKCQIPSIHGDYNSESEVLNQKSSSGKEKTQNNIVDKVDLNYGTDAEQSLNSGNIIKQPNSNGKDKNISAAYVGPNYEVSLSSGSVIKQLNSNIVYGADNNRPTSIDASDSLACEGLNMECILPQNVLENDSAPREIESENDDNVYDIVTPTHDSTVNILLQQSINEGKLKEGNGVTIEEVNDDVVGEKVVDDVIQHVANDDVTQEEANDDAIQEIVKDDVIQEKANDVIEEKVINDVRQDVANDVTQEVANDDVTQDVSDDVTQDVNYDVAQDVNDVTQDVNDDVTQKDINDDVTQKYVNDVTQKDVNDVTQKDVNDDGTQDVNDDVTQEDVNDDVTQEDVNDDVTQKDVNDVTQKDVNDDGTQDVNDDVTREEANDDVTQYVNDDVTQEDVNDDVTQKDVNDVTQKDVNDDGTQDVNDDVTQDVNDDVTQEDVNDDVTQKDVNDVTHKDVNDYGTQDVNDDVTREEANDDVTQDVNDDVTQDVNDDVTQEDVNNDVIQDVNDDVTQEDVNDDVIQEDTNDNVTQDVENDDVTQDVNDVKQEDVNDDVTHEEAIDDIIQDVNDDVTQDVNDDVTQDVNDDVTQDVSDDVTQDVSDDVTQDVNDDDVISEEANDDVTHFGMYANSINSNINPGDKSINSCDKSINSDTKDSNLLCKKLFLLALGLGDCNILHELNISTTVPSCENHCTTKITLHYSPNVGVDESESGVGQLSDNGDEDDLRLVWSQVEAYDEGPSTLLTSIGHSAGLNPCEDGVDKTGLKLATCCDMGGALLTRKGNQFDIVTDHRSHDGDISEVKNSLSACVDGTESSISPCVDGTESSISASVDGTESSISASVDGTESCISAGVDGSESSISASVDGTESSISASVDRTENSISANVDQTESSISACVDGTESSISAGVDGTESSISACADGSESSISAGVAGTESSISASVDGTESSISASVDGSESSISACVDGTESSIVANVEKKQPERHTHIQDKEIENIVCDLTMPDKKDVTSTNTKAEESLIQPLKITNCSEIVGTFNETKQSQDVDLLNRNLVGNVMRSKDLIFKNSECVSDVCTDVSFSMEQNVGQNVDISMSTQHICLHVPLIRCDTKIRSLKRLSTDCMVTQSKRRKQDCVLLQAEESSSNMNKSCVDEVFSEDLFNSEILMEENLADVATQEQDVATQEVVDVATQEVVDVATQEVDVATQEQGLATQEQDVATQEQDVATQEHVVVDVATQEQDVATQEQDVDNQDQGVATKEQDVATQEQDVATQEQDVDNQDQGVATHEQDVATQEQDVANQEQVVVDVATRDQEQVMDVATWDQLDAPRTEQWSHALETETTATTQTRECIDQLGKEKQEGGLTLTDTTNEVIDLNSDSEPKSIDIQDKVNQVSELADQVEVRQGSETSGTSKIVVNDALGSHHIGEVISIHGSGEDIRNPNLPEKLDATFVEAECSNLTATCLVHPPDSLPHNFTKVKVEAKNSFIRKINGAWDSNTICDNFSSPDHVTQNSTNHKRKLICQDATPSKIPRVESSESYPLHTNPLTAVSSAELAVTRSASLSLTPTSLLSSSLSSPTPSLAPGSLLSSVSSQTPSPSTSSNDNESQVNQGQQLLRAKKRQRLQTVILGELKRLNKVIRTSLKVNSADVDQAVSALEDLDLMPISPAVLVEYPTILVTIKKYQNYSSNVTIRNLAQRIYSRFTAMITPTHQVY